MPNNSRRLVFLSGPARSGTTLLYRMLAGGAHHRVFPECGPVTAQLRLWRTLKSAPQDRRAAWFGDETGRLNLSRRLAETLIDNLVRDEPERDVLFLKDPYLIDIHAELSGVFPDIPLLVTIRDPVDILRSRARIAEKRGSAYDLAADIDEVRLQVRRVQALAKARKDDGLFAVLRYETIVAQPEVARERVAEFLDAEITADLAGIAVAPDDPFVTRRSGADRVVRGDERPSEETFSEAELDAIREAMGPEIRYARNAETLA